MAEIKQIELYLNRIPEDFNNFAVKFDLYTVFKNLNLHIDNEIKMIRRNNLLTVGSY